MMHHMWILIGFAPPSKVSPPRSYRVGAPCLACEALPTVCAVSPAYVEIKSISWQCWLCGLVGFNIPLPSITVILDITAWESFRNLVNSLGDTSIQYRVLHEVQGIEQYAVSSRCPLLMFGNNRYALCRVRYGFFKSLVKNLIKRTFVREFMWIQTMKNNSYKCHKNEICTSSEVTGGCWWAWLKMNALRVWQDMRKCGIQWYDMIRRGLGGSVWHLAQCCVV